MTSKDEIIDSALQAAADVFAGYLTPKAKKAVIAAINVIRKNLSPPVPDDVATAIKFCQNFADTVTAEVDIDKENPYYHMLHDTPFRVLGENIKTLIRASSTPSVPADTINIKKEVLQGVRDALERIAEKSNNQFTISVSDEALASLDAVLSEGE